MSFDKFKTLSSADWLKVCLPALALLGIFFLKPMIESYLEDSYKHKLTLAVSSFTPDMEQADADFINALLNEQSDFIIRPFALSFFKDGRFLKQMYNPGKTTVTDSPKAEEQPEPLVLPQYTVSSVFNGNVKKYAVVNGFIAKRGDVFANGDKLTAIGDGCILIEGKWGKQWFYVQY